MKTKLFDYPIIYSIFSILLGLFFGFIIIIIVNPNEALRAISILIQGGFYRGLKSVGTVLYLSSPIMLTGLGVAFAFKCGLFNIGTPGQFIVGAFVSVYVSLKWTHIPNSMIWIIAVIMAGIGGALWAIIPAILKSYRKVNIVISCIMMNYIGMYVVIESVKKTIYNVAGAESYSVPIERGLPRINGFFKGANVNIGIIIALILCIIAYIILTKTTFGFELKACGLNNEASRYAGINDKKCIILSMAISGFFAGVGGSLAYLSGTGKTIPIVETLAAEGFNGIPVALLGFSHPLGVIASSLFISYINVGGNYMQSCNIAIEIIEMIIASIIFFSSFTLIIKEYVNRKRRAY